MPAPRDAPQPFVAATFHEKCPACGKRNRVQITEQFGHSRPQDYHCAHCHHLLGCLTASIPPATSIVEL
jgi:transposase-like protein